VASGLARAPPAPAPTAAREHHHQRGGHRALREGAGGATHSQSEGSEVRVGNTTSEGEESGASGAGGACDGAGVRSERANGIGSGHGARKPQ
jgi:hypothetical protein